MLLLGFVGDRENAADFLQSAVEEVVMWLRHRSFANRLRGCRCCGYKRAILQASNRANYTLWQGLPAAAELTPLISPLSFAVNEVWHLSQLQIL